MPWPYQCFSDCCSCCVVIFVGKKIKLESFMVDPKTSCFEKISSHRYYPLG